MRPLETGFQGANLLCIVNRWVSTRFSLLSCCIVGSASVVCLLTPSIDAAHAGFILVFASTFNEDILYAVSLPLFDANRNITY